MTLFSQVNCAFKKRSLINTATTKTQAMNAIALMAFVLLFLTSILAHADHIASPVLTIDQQECYICHQGLDTPSELPQVSPRLVASYQSISQDVITAPFNANSFVQPQLRAPPIFQ